MLQLEHIAYWGMHCPNHLRMSKASQMWSMHHHENILTAPNHQMHQLHTTSPSWWNGTYISPYLILGSISIRKPWHMCYTLYINKWGSLYNYFIGPLSYITELLRISFFIITLFFVYIDMFTFFHNLQTQIELWLIKILKCLEKRVMLSNMDGLLGNWKF